MHAYAIGVPLATRSDAVSATSTAARAAVHVPTPMGVIVSNAYSPARAAIASGTDWLLAGEQPGVREEVGNDAVLAGIVGVPGGLPEAPRLSEVGDEPLVVDGMERRIVVRLGLDDRCTRLHERLANRERALGALVPRVGKADPDLAARLVEQAVVAPHDRKRERHARDDIPCTLAR